MGKCRLLKAGRLSLRRSHRRHRGRPSGRTSSPAFPVSVCRPPGLPMSGRASERSSTFWMFRAAHRRAALSSKLRNARPQGGRRFTHEVTPLALKRGRIAQMPLPEDREIVSALAGGVQYYRLGLYTRQRTGP